MNFKSIFVLLIVSSLLISSVCAANFSDFKVDDTYKVVDSQSNYNLYANGNNDTGICIYKNMDDKDNDDDSKRLGGKIHDEGHEYITNDDDLNVVQNPDKTANFTDKEHLTKGVSEVVEKGGEKFIIVVWTSSNDVDNNKLMSIMKDFNKENNLSPIAF